MFSLILLISGCDSIKTDTQSIMFPPKATGDEASIQKLIDETAQSKDYVLKYPQKGQYRSAITMTDLNLNNSKEAIAFYKNGTNNSGDIHMLIMGEESGKWDVLCNVSMAASEVDEIQMSDLKGKGYPQIIVSWNSYTESLNRICVYDYNNGSVDVSRLNYNSSYFNVNDFNKDGSNEMFLICREYEKEQNYARLLKYSNVSNAFEVIGEVELNPVSIKNVSTKYAKISDNSYGVVIDSSRANNQMATEVIYWDIDKSTLKNPLYTPNEIKINPTLRTGSSVSIDIDDDGAVEIPSSVTAKSEATANRVDTIYNKYAITQWNNFDISKDALVYKLDTIINDQDGYYIITPQTWETNVTATYNAVDHMMSFKAIQTLQVGSYQNEEEILNIKVFDKNGWEQNGNESDYTQVGESGNRIYAARILPSQSQYSMTMDQVKANLKVIGYIDS
jgi:hypothetical protein